MAKPWTKTLDELKKSIDMYMSHGSNSVLVTRYRSGNTGIRAHSDNEKDVNNDSTIATISIGAKETWLLNGRKLEESMRSNLS